jgi:L-ascorbate metabolism protein UlaG (beta-lactamase superfamily)
MEITWYGLSCFRLMERGMASVVTDPFNHEVAGYQPLKLKADIVTISHDAPGHNHAAAVRGKRHVLTGPGEYEIGGVFITGVQTNGRSKRSVDELRNTLYDFDFDGINVAHLGDLKRVPSQSEIETLGNVDIALVPVGGGRGLSATKAVEVVSLIEPGIVIPMHFGTPGGAIKLAPVNRFLKELGVGNTDIQPSFKISRTSIPTETRVVVLSCEHT